MKKDYIEKTLEYMVIISFLTLILVVFLQVFSRFFLPKAPSWTEELSRFLFIYSIMTAAPIALKRNEFVRVDILLVKLNKKVQHIFEIITYCLLNIFFLIIAYEGFTFGNLGVKQTSPAMGIPMYLSYGTVCYSGIFLLIYGLQILKEKITKKLDTKIDMIKLEEESMEWN
ncbi:TRAP transporter small permease [Cetobacterium sp.]|uniref:TRAP transporter small permease n=1 Tax=Cetobacterium sp. TaxID=2071632 RepID=UPI003AF05BFA